MIFFTGVMKEKSNKSMEKKWEWKSWGEGVKKDKVEVI